MKFTLEYDLFYNLWYTKFQNSMWDFMSEWSSLDVVYCNLELFRWAIGIVSFENVTITNSAIILTSTKETNYTITISASNAVDFGDLLLYCNQLLIHNPDILEH
jgi:superfamily I DNA/RNA helicase